MHRRYPDFTYTVTFVQQILARFASVSECTDEEKSVFLSKVGDEMQRAYDRKLFSEDFYVSGPLKGLEEEVTPGQTVADILRPHFEVFTGESMDEEYPDPYAFIQTKRLQTYTAKWFDAYYEKGIAFMQDLFANPEKYLQRFEEIGDISRIMIAVAGPFFAADRIVDRMEYHAPGAVPDNAIIDLKESYRKIMQLTQGDDFDPNANTDRMMNAFREQVKQVKLETKESEFHRNLDFLIQHESEDSVARSSASLRA
jgi:hypothetical protein